MIRRLILRLLAIVVGLLLTVWLALYLFQDRLIFQSVTLEHNYSFSFNFNFEEHFIPVGDQRTDTLNAIWFRPVGESKGLIIYFHGNRGNLQRWGQYAPNLTRHGYDVLMIDYRGYGKSTGKPGEQAFYRDASEVYQWARGRHPEGKLILYGRSLGSAVASHLATEVSCDLLILETPFDELRGVMDPYFESGARLLPLRYQFSNYENLRAVQSRVIILHGTDDRVVPLSSALRLKPLLQSPEDFVIIPKGGHRNLGSFPEYQQAIEKFLR